MKEEGRRKKEEGRRKREEGRRKREEGRRKKEEGEKGQGCFILEKVRKKPDFVGAGSPTFLLPINSLNKPAPPQRLNEINWWAWGGFSRLSVWRHRYWRTPGDGAGLFHSTVQFSIFVFSKLLPVSKTGVFNNFWFLSRNYRLKLLRHKASRSQEILE